MFFAPFSGDFLCARAVVAAATSASLLGPGRFNLGVGTGEALNEHVLGDHWPEADVRLEMLEEAIHIMRGMWEGGQYSHDGTHYLVENARLYTLPDEPPPDGDRRDAYHVAAALTNTQIVELVLEVRRLRALRDRWAPTVKAVRAVMREYDHEFPGAQPLPEREEHASA